MSDDAMSLFLTLFRRAAQREVGVEILMQSNIALDTDALVGYRDDDDEEEEEVV